MMTLVLFHIFRHSSVLWRLEVGTRLVRRKIENCNRNVFVNA